MGRAVRRGWAWQITQVSYPPEALQCVLVQGLRTSLTGAPEQPKRQVIYVGYHSDSLWREGWLVHEGPREPFTAELAADLQGIGCDLDLQ